MKRFKQKSMSGYILGFSVSVIIFILSNKYNRNVFGDNCLCQFNSVHLTQQTDIYQKIVSQNLSVRETEALVKTYQESLKPNSTKAQKGSSFDIAPDDKKLISTFFGTKVDVKVAGNGKGKIAIPFHSEEDFNRIIKLIKG